MDEVRELPWGLLFLITDGQCGFFYAVLYRVAHSWSQIQRKRDHFAGGQARAFRTAFTAIFFAAIRLTGALVTFARRAHSSDKRDHGRMASCESIASSGAV